MAYVSRGFQPTSNTVYNCGRTETMVILATDAVNTAIFDVVKAANSGVAGIIEGLPSGLPACTRITGVNDVPVGVIAGFFPHPDYLNQTYRSASTLRACMVMTDPNIELMVQEDNAAGGALAVARFGTAVDPVVGSVDTPTGTSGMQISSAALVGSPGMFRLQRRAEAVDNPAMGVVNRVQFIVTFITHAYR